MLPTRDEYEAAGLLDRIETSVDDRLALLEWLSEHGFSIAEMATAHTSGLMQSLASDRIISSGRELTLDEAVAESGIEIDVFRSVLRASGFQPDTAVLTDASIELIREFATARELFSDVEVLHFVRVMGSSLSRIAEAANSLFLLDIETPIKMDKPSELELARQSELATASIDAVSRAIGALFRLHMREAIERSRVARQHATDLHLVPMAVGFVDLVGFTPLTAASSVRELIDLVVGFESRAYDIVNDHGGRLVKLIGDEVMFTTIDPSDACAIAVDMFSALGESATVTPRAGIAYGNMLAHGGDYYGSVVNLASRVADIAVPWEILVTDDLASRVAHSHPTESAGRRLLKGFAEPVPLFEVRREGPNEGPYRRT